MFEWAENKIKLNIAKSNAGKDASEQDVFNAYVKLGGRVEFTPEFPIEQETPDVVLEVKEESFITKAVKKVAKKVSKKK